MSNNVYYSVYETTSAWRVNLDFVATIAMTGQWPAENSPSVLIQMSLHFYRVSKMHYSPKEN